VRGAAYHRKFTDSVQKMKQESVKIRSLQKKIAQLEKQRDELAARLERTQNRYRDLYEGSRDGYAFVGMDGRIEEYNSAFREMIGYDDRDILKKTYEEITPKRWRAVERKIIQEQVLTRGYSDLYEKEYRRGDGKRIPIEIRTYLSRENGSPVGMWAFVRDISDRKKTDRSLLESEQRYKNLIELAPEGIVVSDARGNVVSVNRAFSDITGFSKEEIEGKHVSALPMVFSGSIPSGAVFPEDISTLKEGLNFSFQFRRKDGALRWGEADAGLIQIEGKNTGVQAIVRDITERKKIENALLESEEKYRCVVENAREGIVVAQDGRLKFVNPSICRVSGYTEQELLSRPFIEFIHPEDRALVGKNHEKRLGGEEVPGLYSFRIRSKTGTVLWFQISAVLIEWENRPATLNFLTDITENRTAEDELRAKEQQLLQAQKMEAIGRLAGGVAHDFNNLLTAIIGYTDILLIHPKLEGELKRYVDQIKSSSNRAAALIQQLLAFSRRQMLQVKTVDLNKLVANIDAMLRRVIGEDIELFTLFDKDLGFIRADPGQIEQVIMNLAVNARDAMPEGGKLVIETKNVYLDPAYFENRVNGQPGSYVMFSVTDNGHGMDEETKKHVFEPFFTTKEKGKGTGLGLSTVYGIVKQSGGYVWVYSEPLLGSSFKCYFPRAEVAEGECTATQMLSSIRGGGETILLVEDECIVRNLISNILRHYGYSVVESENGEKALEACDGFNSAAVDMLITDVVMPGMSGRALADALHHRHPGIKVLYISGYTDDAIVRHGILDEGIPFLQKPFAPNDLAKKVRDLLDSR
jgi:two-component system cell cycle sensor histidine kinase/response regulator CckA